MVVSGGNQYIDEVDTIATNNCTLQASIDRHNDLNSKSSAAPSSPPSGHHHFPEILESIRELSGINGHIYLAEIVIWMSLLSLGIFSFFSDSGMNQMLGLTLAALLAMPDVELESEARHRSGFRSRRINHVVSISGPAAFNAVLTLRGQVAAEIKLF